jgi:gas vesicle protein
MSNGNDSGAFWAGFFLGALVGAAVALLMTPQSGEETRLQLQERTGGLKGQFGDVTSTLQERGRVIIEEKVPRRGGNGGEETATEEKE